MRDAGDQVKRGRADTDTRSMKTDGTFGSSASASLFASAPIAAREPARRAPRKAARRTGRERDAEGGGLLVALDSDGTVFDSMTPKHELCFAPAFAERFGRGASREAMLEVWRFVNLGSKMRGTNRYKALAAALRLAARRPSLAAALRREERLSRELEAWLAAEPSPSLARLELALARRVVGFSLRRVLEWSRAVDESIAAMPKPRPFAGAAAALPAMAAAADILVISAAPVATLAREWEGAGLGAYALEIAGQEKGSKSASLAAAMSGRYEPGDVLVVGDAPGDLEAARTNGAAFYPVIPGREEESWNELSSTFLPRFAVREPARGPVAAFLAALPSEPAWRD